MPTNLNIPCWRAVVSDWAPWRFAIWLRLFQSLKSAVQAVGVTMLQFLTSWPVLMALAMAILALAFLIEPAIPARPDGSFTEVAELTFWISSNVKTAI